MSDLQDISKLSNLTYLDLSQNNISDFEALACLFSGCRRLQKLMLKGNPISKKREYKDTIIIMSSPSLVLLDDKEITSNERIFLEKKVSRKSVPTEKELTAMRPPPLGSSPYGSPHGSPSLSRVNSSSIKRVDASVPKLHGSAIGK
jgi:Leucine-rich repeat (LRR) protein